MLGDGSGERFCCEACEVESPWISCTKCQAQSGECATTELECQGDRIWDTKTGNLACQSGEGNARDGAEEISRCCGHCEQGPEGQTACAQCSPAESCEAVIVNCTSTALANDEHGFIECSGHRGG